MADQPVRWGILGTADIAASSFLPALGESGGQAHVVASRAEAPASWAEQHGVRRAVAGYDAVLADPDVEAVYVPLPNSVHAQWSAAALRAGKAVLCEKPLCLDLPETEALLDVARRTGGLLWEAFVFAFQPQTRLLSGLVADGDIGDPVEIESTGHLALLDDANIRWDAALGGGALYDVGCYPVRLARLLFGAEPDTAEAAWTLAPSRVDVTVAGRLHFPGDLSLRFSAGFDRDDWRPTTITGTEGELRVDNPYHPAPGDTVQTWRDGRLVASASPTTARHSFTPALTHIADVLRGRCAPEHLAADEAAGTARALDLLRAAAREAPRH